ncbi:MAG: preprotein translocase subunit SecY [Candidatus Zambryskibacteria bacterium]|nr:preprotein translocase subunit SecY [Candidatus Zambryskibacteria bacterium]
MKNFFYKFGLILQDKALRTRILFTLGALVIFRFLSIIPIPGVNEGALSSLFANNEFLGLLNLFSGGGLSQLSIVMLGVGPYITASIIMQLLTVMSSRLKEMYQEAGDAGRQKFAQYGRMLAIPFALIQGFSLIKLLESQNVIAALTPFDLMVNLIVITAGSMLLMWIGELITEYGIGNGVSLIIFAGIVSQLPTALSQFAYVFDPAQIFLYALFVVIALVVVILVVVVTEAERPIPVTYAKQVRGAKVYGGSSTYLPLRMNQAGVMPIIFGSSILLFPQIISRFLVNVDYPVVKNVATALNTFISNNWIYAIAYFILVFVFTYFYTAVTFDPDQISKNLQKNGAFIPGIRPGPSTADHIAKTLTRLTFVGALFLGVIAVLPLIIRGITGITAISVGGTALLIAVSVVIDLIKKIDAQVSIREY